MGRKRKFKNNYPIARVHHLTIWLKDKNGNVLMTREQLQKCISAHEGAWSTYAFGLHDSDVYDAETAYQYDEKNHRTYLERLRVLSDAAGLGRDETSESGFVFDEGLAKKAQEYADSQFRKVEKGQPKEPHWHVVLEFSNARRTDEIANWFILLNGQKLEPNWDEVKTGRGALESAWLYLVHKNAPKKFQYNPEDIVASFDYVNRLEEEVQLSEAHEKYHLEEDLFNDVIEDVSHGLPIKEAIARVSRAKYFARKRIFDEARRWYIENECPMPLFREVFYVDSEGLDKDHGRGGLGKSALSKSFAKQLAREFGADVSKNINDLQDYIFIAGDANVFLQTYDGQPVVLIDEINGTDFKRGCKGVNGVKMLLAPFPERKSFHKKHGSVVCCAKYIVINGIQSFEAFKESLSKPMKIDGEEQDSEESVKEQFDRRFWGLIHIIDASKVEFWANRGLFENVSEQEVMQLVGRKKFCAQQIESRTSGQAKAQIEARVLKPLLDKVELSQNTHSDGNKISNPNELPEDLLCYGDDVIDDVDDFIHVPAPVDLADPNYKYNARDANDVVRKMSERGYCGITCYNADEIYRLAKKAIAHYFYDIPVDDETNIESQNFIRLALKTIRIIEKGW